MPTFGKTSDGTGSPSTSTTNKVSVSRAAPTETGIVVTGHAQLSIASGSRPVRFAIYADGGGLANPPGALLAESDEITLSETVKTWRTFTFSGANRIEVVAGTYYWIGPAWQSGSPGVTYERDAEAATVNPRREGTLSAWPTLTGPTWAAAQVGPMAAHVTFDLPSLVEPGRFLLAC